MSSRPAPLLEVTSFTAALVLDNYSSFVGGEVCTTWDIGRLKEWSICMDHFDLHISVYSNNHPSKTSAKFQLSILNDKGEKFKSVASELITPRYPSHGFWGFLQRDTLLNQANRLLTRDSLKLLCEVSVVNDIDQSRVHDSKIELFEAFGTLFDSKQCSDVTLETDGCEIKAHKAVLIARSKVFAAMFRHDMLEQKRNRVAIVDISYKVVEEMLRYMYTDKAPNLKLMAQDLLVAAEKYDLEHLKQMCEMSLRNSLTMENAATTLILADQYNADNLKLYTMDFIITNATEIMETRGWNDMVTTHSHLVAEAFCAMAKKQLTLK